MGVDAGEWGWRLGSKGGGWGVGVEAAWSTPDLSDNSPPCAVLCLVTQLCLTL